MLLIIILGIVQIKINTFMYVLHNTVILKINP